MSQPIKCPSLSPKCDGELRVTETEPGGEFVKMSSDGSKEYTPWSCKPVAVRCAKCGKRWTREHLYVEGININDIRL